MLWRQFNFDAESEPCGYGWCDGEQLGAAGNDGSAYGYRLWDCQYGGDVAGERRDGRGGCDRNDFDCRTVYGSGGDS